MQIVRILGFEATCLDCDATVGEPHVHDENGGRDIARCLVTGLQRLMCDHDCGRDI